MRANRSMPDAIVIPVLGYDDMAAAIDWLCRAFGFVELWRVGSHRAQLVLDGGAIVVTERQHGAPGHLLMVRIVDADAHCARAQACGARILAAPLDHPYGERQYTAEDLGGHHWTFSQTIADVAPEEWGGVSATL
jgi:uncharacterized glyoxalase superfamily protein PhnB